MVFGEYRNELKLAKRHHNAGNTRRALFFLGRAKAVADDPSGPHVNRLAIIDHRHAILEAKSGSIDDARWLFRRSSRNIKPDTPLERAMMLRDWGKVELGENNDVLARRKITEALSLLERIDVRTPRIDDETIATRGFLAQVDIRRGKLGALDILRKTAAALHGKKPEYELDPIACLIEHLPVGVERQLYITRAIYLSLRLGNKSQAMEYTVLLGGKPLRRMYQTLFNN